jgi:imidazole glycerol-phosphate synthase subunit HisF
MIPRIIPVLLIENSRLVKTQKFKKRVYIGDPINAIKVFSQKYVDEIIICDISNRKSKEINYNLLKDMSLECFSPLTYAGGIDSECQVSKLFKIGIEKVCINSATRSQPDLTRTLVTKYGSQSITVSVDIIKIFGHYRIYRYEKFLKYCIQPENIMGYLKNLESQGFGELFVNFVNRDGMYTGYDVAMIKTICATVNIPVTVCGGCRDYTDLFDLAKNTNISGIAAGSVFSFRNKSRGVLINYPDIEEIERNLGGLF